jgi:uncharacterized protein (DUF1330 family)
VSAIMISDITVLNEEAFHAYRAHAAKVIGQFGGRYLARAMAKSGCWKANGSRAQWLSWSFPRRSTRTHSRSATSHLRATSSSWTATAASKALGTEDHGNGRKNLTHSTHP